MATDATFAAPIKTTGDTTDLAFGSQVVTALQGRPVASTAPTPGQVLEWNDANNQWTPGAVNATELQGNPVSSTTPTSNQGLVWNGSAWAPATMPGSEIGYDQITSNFTISSTSAPGDTLISGSSYTFDGHPVMAQFYCFDIIPPSVAGNGVNISLYEGTTAIALFSQAYGASSTPMRIPGNGWYRFTPTAGSHTYSVKVYSTSLTGTPQILAGTGAATAPAFLRFTKV